MGRLTLPNRPQRTLPSIKLANWGEREIMTQPRAEGRQEVKMVLLGPNLPPE